jgi:hypothetical protein
MLFLANRNPSLVHETLRCFKNREFLAKIIASGRAEELLTSLRDCTSLSAPIPKIALQVAYNVAALDGSKCVALWNLFKTELASHISKPELSEAASLIVLICCRKGVVAFDEPCLNPIFKALSASKADDSLLAMEAIVLLPNAFESLDMQMQAAVLQCVDSLHTELNQKTPDSAVCDLLEVVSRKFDVLVSSTVFNLKNDADGVVPDEIELLLAMLDLLGTMSASDAYRSCLQEKPFLVVCATGTVRTQKPNVAITSVYPLLTTALLSEQVFSGRSTTASSWKTFRNS